MASDLRARSELLRYYYTECLAHAGAVLTVLLVGTHSTEKLLHLYRLSIWYMPLALLVINVLLWLGIYLGVRTFYWGYMAHEVVYVPPMKTEKLGAYQDEAYDKLMSSKNRWAKVLGQLANVKKWWGTYLFSSFALSLVQALLIWFDFDLIAAIVLIVVSVPAVAYLSHFWRQLEKS